MWKPTLLLILSYQIALLEIIDAEVMIGGEGFTQQSGMALVKTWSLYLEMI